MERARHHPKQLYSEYNRSVGPQRHDLVRYAGEEPRTYVFKMEGLPPLPPE